MFSTFIKLLVANFNFYIFLLLATNSESFHEVSVSENYLKFLSLWTKVCNVESQINIWVTKTDVEQKLKRVQLGLWCVATPTGSEHNFKISEWVQISCPRKTKTQLNQRWTRFYTRHPCLASLFRIVFRMVF